MLPGQTLAPTITNLLDRGGLMSMAGTLLFIFAAFLLAAGMTVSGALERLLEALLRLVGSVASLIAATMAAGATMIAMTSHGGVNPGKYWMFRQQALILADLNEKEAAIKAAQSSLELAEKAKNQDYVRLNTKAIEEWSK